MREQLRALLNEAAGQGFLRHTDTCKERKGYACGCGYHDWQLRVLLVLEAEESK